MRMIEVIKKAKATQVLVGMLEEDSVALWRSK